MTIILIAFWALLGTFVFVVLGLLASFLVALYNRVTELEAVVEQLIAAGEEQAEDALLLQTFQDVKGNPEHLPNLETPIERLKRENRRIEQAFADLKVIQKQINEHDQNEV